MLETLSGDGVSPAFFSLLSQSDDLSFSPTISLPDTILYKFGKPITWYFTSQKTGKILKKSKGNLVNINIEEAMVRNTSAGDIVAYYISQDNPPSNPTSWNSSLNSNSSSKSQSQSFSSSQFPNESFSPSNSNQTLTSSGEVVPQTNIEYFDRTSLHTFLYSRFKDTTGILQRFVSPKGTQNQLIKCIWSPKICLLERRVNARQLNDKRYGIYERAVTFESSDVHSKAVPIRGGVLPSRIQNLCDSIVGHVDEVTFGRDKISRMVLTFKVDAKDRVWLLWSSCVRCEGSRGKSDGVDPVNIESIVRLPVSIRLNTQPSHQILPHYKPQQQQHQQQQQQQQPSTEQDLASCISCSLQSPQTNFHPVPYKSIITHFENLIHLLTSTIEINGESDKNLEWPPERAVITAAGGVGFGPIFQNASNDSRSSNNNHGNHRNTLTLATLTIPPILQALHSKLTVPSFHRYRRDPLFLYKTAMCCESCFLVYAEMETAGFSNYDSKILGGGKGGGGTMKSRELSRDEVRRYRTVGSDGERDNDSKWRPVDDESSSRSYGRKVSSKSVKRDESRDFLGGQGPPGFPNAIRSVDGLNNTANTNANSNTSMSWDQSLEHQRTAPIMTEEIIQKREDQFFKEMASTPAPKKGHPLTHLITAQSKLNSLSSGVKDMEKIGGKKEKAKVNPYSMEQKLVEVVKRGKKSSSNHHKRKDEGAGESHSAEVSGGPSLTISASRHRDFLLSTLNDIQKQLSQPTALKTLVERTNKGSRNAAYISTALPNGNDESIVEEGVEEEEEVILDAKTLKKDPSARGLFKSTMKIGTRICTVTCYCTKFLSSWNLTFVVLYSKLAAQWRIVVTEDDLGFEAGGLGVLDDDKLKSVGRKVVEQMSWVGGEDGEEVGLVFLAVNGV